MPTLGVTLRYENLAEFLMSMGIVRDGTIRICRNDLATGEFEVASISGKDAKGLYVRAGVPPEMNGIPSAFLG